AIVEGEIRAVALCIRDVRGRRLALFSADQRLQWNHGCGHCHCSQSAGFAHKHASAGIEPHLVFSAFAGWFLAGNRVYRMCFLPGLCLTFTRSNGELHLSATHEFLHVELCTGGVQSWPEFIMVHERIPILGTY